MDTDDLKAAFDKLKFGEDAFHELMRWRIRRVLLVLPHYDAWILEHDAKLSDQIVGEYHQLNLTTVPRFTTVAAGEEALELLGKERFDLIIIGMRVGRFSSAELAERAKALDPDLAILMLLASRSDLAAAGGDNAALLGKAIDACFVWTGDSRLFLAMIKYVEDMRNAPEDVGDGRVGALLVVEDSIPFYSAYLPLLYGEMMTQTQKLIAEEMNDSDKYWRMRTRPKILLARDWEEAMSVGETYRHALIGIISDISFGRAGKEDEKAGFMLIESLRSMGISVPVLFQSTDEGLAAEARRREARFQGKLAGNLHRGIRRFLLEELGFGDFVFRAPDGQEVHRVRTLREFELAVNHLPGSTLLYHGRRNDYSRWMGARGEHGMARAIKPVRAEDFPDADAYRHFLHEAFRKVRERRHRGRLVEFSFEDPGAPGSVARYGSGSLGGKGRGLAFFNALLHASSLTERFAPLKVQIPRTLIVATGEFDRFLEERKLPIDGKYADGELRRKFLAAPLPEGLARMAKEFVGRETRSLAIRSSGLLEDSQSLPFAGVYDTYMIPGGGSDAERFRLLSDAIRLVWASTFSEEAGTYRRALGVGREDEKMAVVIQTVAGRDYKGFWFPRLSGTAQSLNYYPVGPMQRGDGAARIAVGLGRSIVGGDRGFLFCPRHPTVPWGTEEDRWREGQTHFWALKNTLGEFPDLELAAGESVTLERLPLRRAEDLGVLRHMASTWDAEGHRLVDGIDVPGPRVVDYRDILAYEWLPLAPLLDHLLRLSQSAMGMPVELEYALDWAGDVPGEAVFSLLQVRPLISRDLPMASVPDEPRREDTLLRSEKALGHGVIRGIRDIVWVDPEAYDQLNTETLRDEVAALMDELGAENRFAVLLGPGRWGSRDRFLGIPVSWAQIRMAKLIVELARGPGDPEPSQGSHFFHNLVALGVGYAHVRMRDGNSYVDWKALRQAGEGGPAVRRTRFSRPMEIVMDGNSGRAWVRFSEEADPDGE